MHDLLKAFLALPIGGRAAIFIGILFLMWCFFGRIILKILSVMLWGLKKVFVGIYMFIEIPVSVMHSKLGSVFGKIDQGLTRLTEKVCNFMDILYGKLNNPKIIYSKWIFVIYLIVSAYLLIPIVTKFTEKPFTFWYEAYIDKEDEFIKWLENNEWFEE